MRKIGTEKFTQQGSCHNKYNVTLEKLAQKYCHTRVMSMKRGIPVRPHNILFTRTLKIAH